MTHVMLVQVEAFQGDKGGQGGRQRQPGPLIVGSFSVAAMATSVEAQCPELVHRTDEVRQVLDNLKTVFNLEGMQTRRR